MRMITADQLKKFHTIVSKNRIDEETKRLMIGGFSGGRTLSSKQLTADEAALIIQHIEKGYDVHTPAIEKMRGKILYYAHEMGWRKPGKTKPVADGKRVDEWMLKYSYLHKKLDAYTHPELPKLVTQFEAVYKHFLKTI